MTGAVAWHLYILISKHFEILIPYENRYKKTGVVVMGKSAFAMSEDPDLYADNYEYQVQFSLLHMRFQTNNQRKLTNYLLHSLLTVLKAPSDRQN